MNQEHRAEGRALGYPRRPVRGANMTADAWSREVERWRTQMLEALQLDVNTIEHWNSSHPNEAPIGTEFERAMMEWVRAFPNGGPPPRPPK